MRQNPLTGAWLPERTRAQVAEAQRIAGARGSHAYPMSSGLRFDVYSRQNGSERLTPAQRRRARKKDNRLYRPDKDAVAVFKKLKGQS